MGKDREMSRNFAEKLKFYRLQRSYSLKDVQHITGIDAGYINKLENGIRRAPSYPILQKLAYALKVDITDLIDIELPENEPLRSVQEVLVFTEYLINGKLPSSEVRENLLSVIQTMLDCDWEEHCKHMDSVKILNKIDIFLRSLKK
ncbi:helix-turn-helix domain-containing protein [Bacillus massilinigeriensis]|uniref:helix-turn-helix domain-containing protein n=1 Tax=Bacillus mediterraneensis TaxID=1805474 RepID=UPI0008F8C3F5|nr:helix-turn-helix transcriptional regulator [Bacillus mediterraneensis]